MKRSLVLALALTLASFSSADAKTLVLYANASSGVAMYDAFSGTPLGTIAPPGGFTNDLAVDRAGNLYLSRDGVTSNAIVYEFAPGATVPDFSYVVPSVLAPRLAVSAAGDLGTVVDDTNFVFYQHGITQPVRTVAAPNYWAKPAIAPDGTLWALAFDLHGRTIASVAPGATSFAYGHVAGRFAPTGGNIALDGRGDLLVMEGPAVTVFDGKTGNVRASVPIVGGFDAYVAMELAPDGKHLFVATEHGTLSIYAWPAGGAPVTTYPIADAFEIALGYR